MRLFAFAIATASILAISLQGPVAFAQTTAKKPAPKVSEAEKNRVVRKDLGFSYIAPATYVETRLAPQIPLVLIGPRPEHKGEVRDQNGQRLMLSLWETAIIMVQLPNTDHSHTAMDFSADGAKAALDSINQMQATVGRNPLNYQNSAKINIDGHETLAVLAETTSSATGDRLLVRVLVLQHAGKVDIFAYGTEDDQFETRVPSFEAFMKSVKFLEPNVEPDAAASGPVQINIGH